MENLPFGYSPSGLPSSLTCPSSPRDHIRDQWLRVLESIHNFPISYKLVDPTDSHPAQDQPSLRLIDEFTRDLRALLRISKLLMVPD